MDRLEYGGVVENLSVQNGDDKNVEVEVGYVYLKSRRFERSFR